MLKSLKLWCMLLFSLTWSTQHEKGNEYQIDNKTDEKNLIPDTEKMTERTQHNDIIRNKDVNTGQNISCRLIFKSEQDIKEAISKIYTAIFSEKAGLSYLHVEIENFSEKDDEFKNRLTEWQIIDPENDLLHQRPIDYSLLTFDFSDFINKDAKLHLTKEPSDCQIKESDVEEMKALLWDNVLANFSTYYLCNRNFSTGSIYRFVLFYITTVWKGYDLECQTMSQWRENKYRYLEKDAQHDIITIGCFLVAIQFFWLYHLITEKANVSLEYKKGDRPRGVKRVFEKFLYKQVLLPNNLIHTWIDTLVKSPTFRFAAVTNWSLLLFIGLYRVIYRHYLAETHFHSKKAVLSSEPVCDFFSNDTIAYTCDLSYMLISSYSCVFLTFSYYKYNRGDDGGDYEQLPGEDEGEISTSSTGYTSILSNFLNKALVCYGFILPKNKFRSLVITVLLFPFLIIVVFLAFIIHGILFIFLVIINGLVLPAFCRRSYPSKCCRTKTKILGIAIIVFGFSICSRSMISSLVFILRSITYHLFITFPLQGQMFHGFIIGVFILTYFLKYQIGMIDTNAVILSIIFEKVDKKYVDEQLYSYVVANLKSVRNMMNVFLCKCFLVLIYFLLTLKTISKSEHNSGNVHELLLSILTVVFPWIVDAYFRKALTEEDEEKISELIYVYYITTSSYRHSRYTKTDGSNEETYPMELLQ